jgi:hypothetical protein
VCEREACTRARAWDVRACACVRACVHACVRVCVCACGGEREGGGLVPGEIERGFTRLVRDAPIRAELQEIAVFVCVYFFCVLRVLVFL